MRQTGWFRRSRSGVAAAELAIVLPVLLLLIIGVADYGRAFYTSVTVANAARAGAEFAAASPAAAGGDTVLMNKFAQSDGSEAGTLTLTSRRYCECGAGNAQPSCTACSGGAAPDVYFEVTARKDLNTLLRYPGLPTTITIIRRATFRSQ